jgi:hypothetical protein
MQSVLIQGPRGGQIRDAQKILDFTCIVCDILNLYSYKFDLEIIVHPTYIHHYPDAMGLCYEKDDNNIQIHLARKCVEGLRNPLYQTLTHELLHARQTAKGEKMYERPVRKHEEFIYELAKERMT